MNIILYKNLSSLKYFNIRAIFALLWHSNNFWNYHDYAMKKLENTDRKSSSERKEKGGTREKGFSGAREIRLIDRRTPAESQIPKDRTFPITVNMQPRHWFNVTGARASVPQ